MKNNVEIEKGCHFKDKIYPGIFNETIGSFFFDKIL